MDEREPTQAAQPSRGQERRLTRREDGKVIAGVAAGLGAYTGTDPVLWRIGFVVLTLFSGVGLIGYLVAWLIMPKADPDEPPGAPPEPGRGRTWLGIAALVLGVALLAHEVWPWSSGVVWGLLAIGVGIALWSHDGGRSDTTGERPPEAQPARSVPAAAPSGAGTAPPPPPPAASAVTRDERREPPRTEHRRGWPLGRLTLGAAAIALGGGLIGDNLGLISLTWDGMAAALLIIVGIGLVVGAWWGRGRWLIVPGVVLASMIAGAATVPNASFEGGFGDRLWRPTSLVELREQYRLAAGDAVLDLTQLRFEDEIALASVQAHVQFGELLVLVPEDVQVTVRARVQGGEMDVLERVKEGWDLRETVRATTNATGGELQLDARVGFGELVVRRGPAPPDLVRRFQNRGPHVEVELGARSLTPMGGRP